MRLLFYALGLAATAFVGVGLYGISQNPSVETDAASNRSGQLTADVVARADTQITPSVKPAPEKLVLPETPNDLGSTALPVLALRVPTPTAPPLARPFERLAVLSAPTTLQSEAPEIASNLEAPARPVQQIQTLPALESTDDPVIVAQRKALPELDISEPTWSPDTSVDRSRDGPNLTPHSDETLARSSVPLPTNSEVGTLPEVPAETPIASVRTPELVVGQLAEPGLPDERAPDVSDATNIDPTLPRTPTELPEQGGVAALPNVPAPAPSIALTAPKVVDLPALQTPNIENAPDIAQTSNQDSLPARLSAALPGQNVQNALPETATQTPLSVANLQGAVDQPTLPDIVTDTMPDLETAARSTQELARAAAALPVQSDANGLPTIPTSNPVISVSTPTSVDQPVTPNAPDEQTPDLSAVALASVVPRSRNAPVIDPPEKLGKSPDVLAAAPAPQLALGVLESHQAKPPMPQSPANSKNDRVLPRQLQIPGVEVSTILTTSPPQGAPKPPRTPGLTPPNIAVGSLGLDVPNPSATATSQRVATLSALAVPDPDLLTLPSVELVAAPLPDIAKQAVFVTGARVNMRGGPGTDHPVLSVTTFGTKLTLLQTAAGWSRVSLNDATNSGWMSSKYLSNTLPKANKPRAVTRTRTEKRRVSRAEARRAIIRRALSRTNAECPCPYSRDRSGALCGGDSKWNKLDGFGQICFEGDVSEQAIQRYIARLR